MNRPQVLIAEESLSLRPLSASDLGLTLEWRNKLRIRSQFITSDVIPRSAHDAWFSAYSNNHCDFVYVIAEEDRDVGQISLYDIDWEAGSAEFGRLMIGEDDRLGTGLASRATKLLLMHAVEDLKLKRISLQVFEDNLTAIRIYEKAGFAHCSGNTTQDDRLITMIYNLNG